jgi:RNA polymerase sigma-70 factor (ECF subfamily)
VARAEEIFTEHRGLLVGVAYRILGSAADAEDVVQEAWLRWSKVDHETVEQPRAFLITTVSRLAIDRLRQVKAQREAYVGPWLPEPVSDAIAPGERAERADSVELAMLVVLETLSPLERAVFVLREAFELPFSEIAEVIGREEPATRQLAKRAREHVQSRRPRFEVDRARRRQVTQRFIAAAVHGDLGGLTSLLARDVELVSDGGGRARSPIKVLTGIDHVVRFLTAIATPHAAELFLASIGARTDAAFEFGLTEVNGAPAMVAWAGGRAITVVSLVIVDDLVQTIYLVANPDKLRHITP